MNFSATSNALSFKVKGPSQSVINDFLEIFIQLHYTNNFNYFFYLLI